MIKLLRWLNSKRKRYGRKYLEDLGISFNDIPENWNTDCLGETRWRKWRRQRRKYGFDERETWSLDYTLAILIYERLKMYNEINYADTRHEMPKIEHKGESLYLQDCIDCMLEGFKEYIKTENPWDKKDSEKIQQAFDLLALCWKYLWW